MRRSRRAATSAPAGTNPGVERTLQEIRTLRHRAARDRSGRFYVEGIRFLADAIEHGARIETLVVSWRLLIHPFARQQVRRLRRMGTPTVLVSPEEFRSVSEAQRACGVGLVIRQHWTPASTVDPRRGTAWLLLRQVRAPGNLGTLLRSLAAVGGGGALFCGDAADPFDPATVRATMGALFGLQLCRVTAADIRRLKAERGCTVIGTSAGAEADYGSVEWGPGAVVFLGSERKGLSDDDVALCDHLVRIPMTGGIDSLNLGVAGSLMLYEAFRARARHEPKPGP